MSLGRRVLVLSRQMSTLWNELWNLVYSDFPFVAPEVADALGADIMDQHVIDTLRRALSRRIHVPR